MAGHIVTFVLNQLSVLLRDEAKLLGGLRQEIQHIVDELGHIKALLRSAEPKEEDDSRLQEWIMQVQDVAYDIQDVMDEFMLRFGCNCNHGHGFYGHARKVFTFTKNLQARHQIAFEIQSIKSRILNISESHKRYPLEYGTSDQVSASVAVNNLWHCSRDEALLVEEAKLVGIDIPKQQLISQLVDGYSQLKVVSVLGMGGIGKTTLVKKVQEDANVKRQFEIFAWATVSQTCDMKELLKDLIQQLYQETGKPVPQQVASMNSTDRLKAFIKDFLLEKRYLIVFDDVWDLKFWDVIKFALPDGNCGSRAMLTTRIADVAYASDVEFHSYVHKMQPLSSDESWNLFCKKTFKDNCCPDHLKDLAKGILRKCEGLPLAIVAISGVLALKDKRKVDEWNRVELSLGGEMEGSGKLDRVRKILSLSYNDLPYHLMTCLLYVSVYPEDYEIEDRRLIRFWIAEGFVQERTGMTKFEVAKGYLDELTNRSLIQLIEDNYNDGLPTFYRIHDLLRELLLSKSRKEQFASIATGGQHIRCSKKVRRLAIHDFIGDTQGSTCAKHLRSLITFSSMSKSSLYNLLCGCSRLLKVLDLEGAQLEEIPDQIFELFHLKTLNLKRTRVKIISKSIARLQNLEYLNLAYTNVTELPVEILKLQGLCHLSAFGKHFESHDSRINGVKFPNKVGRLLFLEWLFHIEADRNGILVREIGELKQLKKLGITNLRREDGKELLLSLAKLTNLQALNVQAIEKDEIIDLNYWNHSVSSSLKFLQALCLRGSLEKVPQFISFLKSLTIISLFWSGLLDDPLESLQHLPNLQTIYLNQAYQGDGLCFKTGCFLKLERLVLISLHSLRLLQVEEGAIPNLRELRMTDIKLLEDFPLGIQHLIELHSLYLRDMSDKLIAKVQNLDEESESYPNITHIPGIFIWTDKDGYCRLPLLHREKNKLSQSSCHLSISRGIPPPLANEEDRIANSAVQKSRFKASARKKETQLQP